MNLALEEARAALRHGQSPFGAVVATAGGEVAGRGHNLVRESLDPTAHGEIMAIRDAIRKLGGWSGFSGATLYSSCEPCLLCCQVVVQLGFSRVVVAARCSDVPGYEPLLGARLADVAAWANTKPGLTLEVCRDFMRERALEIMATFSGEPPPVEAQPAPLDAGA